MDRRRRTFFVCLPILFLIFVPLFMDSLWCVCVGVFVWPVALDVTKMISDRGGGGIPRLVHGTLLGTSSSIHRLMTRMAARFIMIRDFKSIYEFPRAVFRPHHQFAVVTLCFLSLPWPRKGEEVQSYGTCASPPFLGQGRDGEQTICWTLILYTIP